MTTITDPDMEREAKRARLFTRINKGYAGEGLENVYSNPLPHVLMLTAIVVGVATLAVGLAIIVRIREAYGTVEADEIRAMDLEVAIAEAASDAEKSKAGAA